MDVSLVIAWLFVGGLMFGLGLLYRRLFRLSWLGVACLALFSLAIQHGH